MIIHTYENSGRTEACAKYLETVGCICGIEEAVILPIPSTKDSRLLSGTDIPLSDVLKMAGPRRVIVGYGLPRELALLIKETGAKVYDASLDEEFLLGNADLTAIATLGIIIGSEKRAPKDLLVGIVGYGRIGKRLARLLLFLGAGVRIYTSNDSTRLELCEFGVASAMSTSEADLSGLDILINTAPAVIFNTEGGTFPGGLRVIDLASGENFPGLMDVERYPSIPAKMFPYSAGRMLGESCERYLRGMEIQSGEVIY